MNEEDLMNFLTEAIETLLEERGDDREDCSYRTFEDAMILTNNKGLVISLNGSEFQVTIVKS
jgi:hypothetical protein